MEPHLADQSASSGSGAACCSICGGSINGGCEELSQRKQKHTNQAGQRPPASESDIQLAPMPAAQAAEAATTDTVARLQMPPYGVGPHLPRSRFSAHEPEPEPELDLSNGPAGRALLVASGCKCRGLVHWQCLAQKACRDPRGWLECMVCGHAWAEGLALQLALERKHRAEQTKVIDVEWACATMELSRALLRSGDYAEALRIGSQGLPEMCRVLGPEHSVTVNARIQLASIYTQTGDNAAALRLHDDALRIQRKVLGSDHPIVLAAIEDLAMVLIELEDLSAALPLLTEHLATTRRMSIAGDERGLVALTQSLSNLANCCSRIGRHDEALPLAKEASELSAQVLGSNCEEAGYYTGQLGDIMYNMGEIALAVPVLEQAVAALTAATSYGDEHPLTVHFNATLQNAAEILYKDGIEAALRELILSHADDAPKETDVRGLQTTGYLLQREDIGHMDMLALEDFATRCGIDPDEVAIAKHAAIAAKSVKARPNPKISIHTLIHERQHRAQSLFNTC